MGRGLVVTALVGALLAVSPGTAGAATPPVAFAPPVDYALDSGPTSVATGDLDGDTHADLITVGVDVDEVFVLFGNGDGTLASPVGFGTGPVPYSVAVGDLDSDGDLDLIVTNLGRSFDYDDTSVSVLLNNGDGTFLPDAEIPAHFGPVQVAIEDLNGDADPDLLLTHAGFVPIGLDFGRVSVMLGDGYGGFVLGYTTLFGDLQTPLLKSALGDVTGDGHPDIAVVAQFGGGSWLLVGNGDGTFDPPALVGGGGAVVIGDLDGDGANELVYGYYGDIAVLAVAADGTVSEATTFPMPSVSPGPVSLAVGDLNGDSHLDVVASGRDQLNLLLGNGDGTLDPGMGFPIFSYLTPVALADFDGDDRLDVVTGEQDGMFVSVLLNETVDVVPGAPTIGSVTAGVGSATVAWSAPVADGGSPVLGYVVTPYIGFASQGPRYFSATETTQTVTGLTSGATYRFKVRAWNAVGVGPFSGTSGPVTMPSAPGAPVIGTARAGAGAATLSWATPASNGGSPIGGYVVTPYIGYVPQGPRYFGATATTRTIMGLTNGTTYRFKVRAWNAAGVSVFSGTSNPVTPTP